MIEARGLTKRFSTNDPAVDDVDLTVRPGEVCCILGGSGAGKTTLIRLLAGLLRPTTGRSWIDGVDPCRNPIEGRKRFVLMSADSALFNSMTPWQNLQFLCSLSGTAFVIDRSSAENSLRRVGLSERELSRSTRQLSRHVTVCVWLALASLRNVPAVFLDEPTAGLDARGEADLHEALDRFRAESKALLIATADVFFAGRAANRVCILKRGRKVVERTSAQLLGSSVSDLYFDYTGRVPGRTTEP